MHQRINVTLPEETIRMLDRLTKKRDRSRFIDTAVRRYVKEVGGKNLRQQMKAGAIRDAEFDLSLAEDWFQIDEESWRHEAAE